MASDILVESMYGRTRVAVVEDGRLRELYSEQAGSEKLVGNIYMGRVENVLPGMQAAFVDIGLDRNAFLYAGDLKPGPDCQFSGSELRAAQIPIQKLVKRGQEIMVQVIKEPGGAKGPRVSTHITLPGHVAVLLPTVEYVGVSRRIASEDRREELRQRMLALKPEGMGVIVRTAGEDAGDAEFDADMGQLVELWRQICARARHVKAPRLIHADETLVVRAVRDRLALGGSRMLIEDARCYDEALGAAQELSPALAARIERYAAPRPLFRLYGVDEQAERALARRVWLKSGGYIVIDYAEAMTVIDVNTGKYVGSRGLQDTVVRVNLEAAEEIADQLRLRDIGGIVVIDFIDMESPDSREQVIQALRTALKRDHTRTNVIGITGLGMLEMTRKKVHHPIRAALTQPCRACGGEGWVYSADALARRALLDVRERDSAGAPAPLVIRAGEGVVRALADIGVARAQPVYAAVDERIKGYEIEPAEGEVSAALRLRPYREDER